MAAAVDLVAAVAVPVAVVAVESVTAGNRQLLIETGLSGPNLPNLLLDGITRRGPEFLQKTE